MKIAAADIRKFVRRDLKRSFAALCVDWYLFGAQAALIYGASRVTADIDITVRRGANRQPTEGTRLPKRPRENLAQATTVT